MDTGPEAEIVILESVWSACVLLYMFLWSDGSNVTFSCLICVTDRTFISWKAALNSTKR